MASAFICVRADTNTDIHVDTPDIDAEHDTGRHVGGMCPLDPDSTTKAKTNTQTCAPVYLERRRRALAHAYAHSRIHTHALPEHTPANLHMWTRAHAQTSAHPYRVRDLSRIATSTDFGFEKGVSGV